MLPVVLINDGRVLQRNLQSCGKDAAWLDAALGKYGLEDPKDVFLLTVDERERVVCVRKEGRT